MTLLATILAAYGDRFGRHGHRPLRVLVLVLFLVLIGTVIWLVVREVRHRRDHSAPPPAIRAGNADAALEQLRMRYARSEVTRDEYLQMAQDLGAPGVT
jgi:putative membrane protein